MRRQSPVNIEAPNCRKLFFKIKGLSDSLWLLSVCEQPPWPQSRGPCWNASWWLITVAKRCGTMPARSNKEE
jgi:hypothetical protein